MTAFIPSHFELLKNRVLATAGLSALTPADCRLLSTLIFNATKQNVSETTLKRIYGFAHSRFKPSIFTINALAQYSGYANWKAFYENLETDAVRAPEQKMSCAELKHNADRITHYTLQILKKRSGLAYHQTIKRKFIDDHIDLFMQGDYTATLLTAPAGYGKTIALCHWVEEGIRQNNLKDNHNIYLFFSSNAMVNASLNGLNVQNWIATLLGFSNATDMYALLEDCFKNDGKFYLIIDGFDEHMFKYEQFQLLINQITDTLALYDSAPWFKLILTMRSASYSNNKHSLIDRNIKWFLGFIPSDEHVINVPLFSIEELKQLCTLINPAVIPVITPARAAQFNLPLYFQFYYQNNPENFTLNNVNQIGLHELVSSFILNKVYLGHYSAEKVLLVKELVSLMNFKNKVYNLNKLHVNHLLRQYPNAYQELVAVGFLRELNISQDLNYNTYVQFGNNNFLEYSIAKTLLLEYDYQFDERLINLINNSFYKDSHKVPVIKWALIYALSTGQQNCFEHVSKLQLTPTEKAELLMFLGDMFEKEHSPIYQSDLIKEYFNNSANNNLFNYFFGIEFMNAAYKSTLTTLLKFKLSTNKRIMIHTGLAFIALVEMNAAKFEEHIIYIKNLPAEDTGRFPINPLHCLETIYDYLKFGIINKTALVELTRFSFNPPKVRKDFLGDSSNNMLYILALYTLYICLNPRKILRFINVLRKMQPDDQTNTTPYNFLLRLIAANANFANEPNARFFEEFNAISDTYQAEKSEYTPLMRVSYHFLKLKTTMCHKEDLAGRFRSLNYLADESGYKLIKVYALLFLINEQQSHNISAADSKQHYNELVKLIRESGFRMESFMQNSSTAVAY